jgi:hypothetical protein
MHSEAEEEHPLLRPRQGSHCGTICLMVVIGVGLGCLFVAIREAAGMKM